MCETRFVAITDTSDETEVREHFGPLAARSADGRAAYGRAS